MKLRRKAVAIGEIGVVIAQHEAGHFAVLAGEVGIGAERFHQRFQHVGRFLVVLVVVPHTGQRDAREDRLVRGHRLLVNGPLVFPHRPIILAVDFQIFGGRVAVERGLRIEPRGLFCELLGKFFAALLLAGEGGPIESRAWSW